MSYGYNRNSDRRQKPTRWDTAPGIPLPPRPLAFYDHGGAVPKPQGIHTRFDDNGKEEAPATGSKRERSREPERSDHGSSRAHRDREAEQDGRRRRDSPHPNRSSTEPSKRAKLENASSETLPASDFDEINFTSQSTNHSQLSRSTPAIVSSNESETV
ncbi:hypothetical protein C8R44DRAFT_177746 [Mycena epipterygia]|nr:hypothetical protein C8R44DRAFT_177746 [Mycena epipterygia]